MRRLLLFIIIVCKICNVLQAQTKPLPVSIAARKSLWGKSYVLQLTNLSREQLTVVLLAKEKTASFAIPAGQKKDIGWAQGFSFDANNHFAVTADGFDTIKQVMPSTELAPWKLTFTEDRGLAISLSKSLLQQELPKNLGLPIKQKASNVFEISLSDSPVLDLREGSNRIYADATLHASILGKVKFPVLAKVSFVPSYSGSTRQLIASEILVDQIDVKLLPAEWTEVARQIVNEIIRASFSKVVLYELDRSEQKYAKLTRLRDVRVKDGRLEMLIL